MQTRYFALIAGVVYLLVGAMGFIPPLNPVPAGGQFPHPSLAVHTLYGHQLGLFPINLVHNIVHLAIGAWGIYAYRSFTGSIAFARGLTILYALLAVMGLPFMPDILKTNFGMAPLYGADVLLHAGTALVAAYFGWVAPARDRPDFVDASRQR
jgi:hypothetical protein